jgi:hypothetical protein
MKSCVECGDSISGVSRFTCSYCGATTCPTHHVPESHDCPELHAASPPPLIRKHVDLGITSDPSAAKTMSTDDSRPETRAILRPESYPAKRRTEPMPESEQSPGGKQHRDWTPESKSPDVNTDGSIAGEETARLQGGGERALTAVRRRLRLWGRTPLRTLLRLVVVSIVLYAVYFVLGSV